MSTIRINQFTDPARGGQQMQALTFTRRTTVLYPGGITKVTTTEYFKDIGTLMREVPNHVPEQPTNRWKQALIERERASAAQAAENA